MNLIKLISAQSFYSAIYVIVLLIVLIIFIKNYLIYKEMATAKRVKFKFQLKTLFFILVYSKLLIIAFPFFFVYKCVIRFILFCKHGSKYGGLLDGHDAFFCWQDDNVTDVLCIIQYEPNNEKGFYEYFKDTVYKEFVLKGTYNSKLVGAIRSFTGYYYIIKDEIKFDNCQKLKTVKSANEELNEDELFQIIESYSGTALPKNHETFWEVFIGTQSVRWDSNIQASNTTKYYPVLFRFNHALADGYHVLNAFNEIFGDKKKLQMDFKKLKVPTFFEPEQNGFILDFIKNLVFQVIFYIKLCFVLYISPSILLVNALLMTNESKPLDTSSEQAQKKYIHSYVDNRFNNYVKKAKKIKDRVPGCTFANVFLVALSASFREYLQEKNLQVPEYITMNEIVPGMINVADVKQSKQKLQFRNRISVNIRNLPINIDFENTKVPLLKILETISNESKHIKTSIESQVYYTFFHVFCNLVPSAILKPMYVALNNCTAIITNVPGPRTFKMQNGCLLQDIVFFIPTVGHAGIGYTLFTYNERLQLSLAIDRRLVVDRSDMKRLVNGILKYIDVLDGESKSCSHSVNNI